MDRAGGVVAGALYQAPIPALIIVTAVIQPAALAVLVVTLRRDGVSGRSARSRRS